MSLPHDYIERVYAGVLGKIIGVYLGRPFEGWTYEKIMADLGEINYYVHEKRNVPLVVTDDDISGTFSFIRALPDFGNSKELTPRQIGQTWLNYLIEKRTVLWWGGMGNSTEHTAYLRLKKGISAPLSGAAATNGKVVSEQIGSQIFIDGWAMVAPGDPALAVDLAKRAASVSHDGEAIYGAQVLAAMESLAFIDQDIEHLLDCGVSFIPRDSVIYRMIADVRGWRAALPDWKDAYKQIAAHYGYDQYGGNCHIVPNHALIILGLLYGDGDFQKSLMITNTAGWDTDCNSGNIGCLLGIRNGLAGIDSGPDWRGPVADRLYLPTADGGRVISDALTEAYILANSGRAMHNLPAAAPKGGARFHFSLPGSLQGFQAEPIVNGRSPARVFNASGHSLAGERSLGIAYAHTAPGYPARAATQTFLDEQALSMSGYGLMACPTLYPGQLVEAGLEADSDNHLPAEIRLFLRYFGHEEKRNLVYGPALVLQPGVRSSLNWRIPEIGGYPIAEIGLEIESAHGQPGIVYLDTLTWSGAPNTTFVNPAAGFSRPWHISWINAASEFHSWGEPFRVIQDEGTGLLIQGTADWDNYRVETVLTPHLAERFGLAARVQGLQRYYALVFERSSRVKLIKVVYDQTIVLGEADYSWELYKSINVGLAVVGNHLTALADGKEIFNCTDPDQPYLNGGIALLVTEGRLGGGAIQIQPL